MWIIPLAVKVCSVLLVVRSGNYYLFESDSEEEEEEEEEKKEEKQPKKSAFQVCYTHTSNTLNFFREKENIIQQNRPLRQQESHIIQT